MIAGRREVETTVAQTTVLWTVRASAPGAEPLPGENPRRFGLRRSPPVRRVDDERRTVVELPVDQPERVVVAGHGVEVLELRVSERLLDEPVTEEIAGLL